MSPLLMRRRIPELVGLLYLLGVLAARTVAAQSPCPPPLLNVLLSQHEVPAAGAAFTPHLTVRVRPAPACGTDQRYQFREAEVTLLRGRRPVLATQLVHTAEVDLTAVAPFAQPGDRIYVFVRYENLYLMGPTGKRQAYAKPPRPSPGSITAQLVTDEAQGISFTWLLTK
jgi:hypothetical protein